MKTTPTDAIVDTLLALVNIPSPTGRTHRAIQYIVARMNDLGGENMTVQRTNKGGLNVTVPGRDRATQRVLTAHVDTLGAMVKEIKEDGRLKLSQLGGYSWHSVDGEYCTVETGNGQTISGTILATHTSVHVYADAREQARTEENMEVRLDAPVKSEADVHALGINVGDFVSFDARAEKTAHGFVKSRHLDDKASTAILVELIRYLVKTNTELPYTTHFMFSTFEEVGFGANSGIPEGVREYLAVDMGAIGEGQATDEYCVSICAKDSSGPYNYDLRQKLVALAEQHDIYYQVDIYPFYGSDASAAVEAGADLIHGLVGPGIDASHAYERTHEDALSNTFRLLYHYVLSPSL
ncbi:M42 family metallopeptidase [Numidum massiliense]|uniref:M42 family metallopeptidase n=1 Tax=Numidum massiliense TaxID=1522315 RepID=UPI000AE567D2|nr:M42 family metallopeptidase [Numidum massiliense]